MITSGCRRVVGPFRLRRHADGQAGKSAPRRGDTHTASDLMHEIGDQVHPYAATRVLRSVLDGGKSRLEQQGVNLLRVQALRLFGRDESLLDGDLLYAPGGQALTVV